MNYKKIVIPCLYNNPELETYNRANLANEEISDEELLERDVYFYQISCVAPRVSSDGIVIGTIIYSGNNEYISLLLKHEVDEIIRKTFEQ